MPDAGGSLGFVGIWQAEGARWAATLVVVTIVGSLITAGTASASGMTLDPSLPLPEVTVSAEDDGTATITLVYPVAKAVCVWGVEWDTDSPGEHGYAPGLRPGGKGPSQGGAVAPVCGNGDLPTTLTITPAQVGSAATEVRVLWTPASDVWSHSGYTTVSWPPTQDPPASAPEIALAWSPSGDLQATATAPNPCHWRFESRLGNGSWTGDWVGGAPGEPCAASAPSTWIAPTSLWQSAGEVRAAYTTSASSKALSTWATASYSYALLSGPSLDVSDAAISIAGVPPLACRVAVSWLMDGAWTSAAPAPPSGCGLPGVGATPPISFSDAPEGAKQVRVAYLSTPAAESLGAWSAPIPLTGLLPASDPAAVEQADGSIKITFTDPNPPGTVCAWRWELRRQGTKNIYGAGSQPTPLKKKTACQSTVVIPAALDDPANLDLVLWPDADGTNDPADEAPKVYVSLPDVNLSAPVKTGKEKGPSLTLGWHTSQDIAESVPRAKVSAPGKAKGTCSYRVEWTADGVTSRGAWISGSCQGTSIELPQLAAGWNPTWQVKAAWAKGDVGTKGAEYSSFSVRTWDSSALDQSTIQLIESGQGSLSWFVTETSVAACNAQAQLLSTTDPATWQVVGDSYAVPLGLCDDLWAQHAIASTSAKAIRVRLTGSTADKPAGRWMYAALTQPLPPVEPAIRWNDAGTPVVTFADPNPPGSVCYWQIKIAHITIDDVAVAPDGSTSCSSTTTFELKGDIDWTNVTSVLIRGSQLPEETAIEGWGPLAGSYVPYSPRLSPGTGNVPKADIAIDQAGLATVNITGTSCRYVAQWRVQGEALWQTESPSATTECASKLTLLEAGATADLLDVRVAEAQIAGGVATVGPWSQVASTTDPMPTPEVALWPTSRRVRVQNQPASLCGTWFELQRTGKVIASGLVRDVGAPGQLDCGPWAVNTEMIAYTSFSQQPGDKVRFAFVRGVGAGRIMGPWSDWRTWPSDDSAAPALQVTAPTDGASVTGTVVSRVTATDDVGVERIEIHSGTRLLATALTPSSGSSWSIPWDSWTLANGATTLTVTAYDTSGNIAQAESRLVIANPTPVEKVPSKGARPVVISMALSGNPAKPPHISVERGEATRLRLSGKVFAGAVATVRIGKTWVSLGSANPKLWLPAVRVNGPGPYLVRMTTKFGKKAYFALVSEEQVPVAD
ncbi:MAG: Ig-like domain-containing protein [Candidatus Nanopelagicales bacterium]